MLESRCDSYKLPAQISDSISKWFGACLTEKSRKSQAVGTTHPLERRWEASANPAPYILHISPATSWFVVCIHSSRSVQERMRPGRLSMLFSGYRSVRPGRSELPAQCQLVKDMLTWQPKSGSMKRRHRNCMVINLFTIRCASSAPAGNWYADVKSAEVALELHGPLRVTQQHVTSYRSASLAAAGNLKADVEAGYRWPRS